MTGKYQPLTDALARAAHRGQVTVDLEFSEIDELVGGLPPSASALAWWSNSSHVQALAWREADFHVDHVYLDRRRVRFSRGRRGGSYHDRGRDSTQIACPASTRGAQPGPELVPTGEPVQVQVAFRWLEAGPIRLDEGGKLVFPPVPAIPGLYLLTLLPRDGSQRPQLYIGESDNLRRRLTSNYRSPGPSQATSLRINALLTEHLATPGAAIVAICTSVEVDLAGASSHLDLGKKSSRLLAENAALVVAHARDDAVIANLP